MPIIDDFADIAKRMKGELAPKPKVEEEPSNPAPTLAEMISNGWLGNPQPANPPGNGPCPPAPPWPMGQAPKPMLCPICRGTGMDMHSLAHLCPHCQGKGLAP